MRQQDNILALLHARSEQAIEGLRQTYGGLCSRIAGNILSSPEDVEEVVSDTFLAAWNNIPPEEPVSLSAYLSRITRNLSVARLRRNAAAMRNPRMMICLSELEECIAAPDTPELVTEGKLLTQAIHTYLNTLTPVNRFVFLRRYYYLDSCQEIADAAKLTEQAVRLRLMRIRMGLQEYLKKEEIMEWN